MACALIHVPLAHAQEPVDLASMSLEQLLDLDVVTASRFEQKMSHAPSVVQVIDAAEIRAHGWRTLGEALDSLPGLYLSDTGLYTYLGARGLLRAGDYDTRFLLLVNGHRINDPVYSQSPVGIEFPLDMSLVERIEYVPGPGSAVYGSNAFFGVINVLTRTPRSMGDGELRATVGSHGTHDVQATLATSSPRSETLLSARQVHIEGRTLHFPEFADTASGGRVQGQDDERTRQLFVSHVAGDLSLQLVAGDRRKEDPVAPYGQRFATPGAEVQDRWIEFGTQYSRALDADTRWNAQLDVIDYRYLGDYVYGEDEPYLNRDIAEGVSVILGARLVSTGWRRHTLVAGVESQWDRRVRQRNFDAAPYADYLDTRANTATWGVYLDDEITLSAHWRFNGGLRVDHSDLGTLRLSPRMALIHSRDDGSTFKAIVGKAYRSPNAYERYYNVVSPEGDQYANPALNAEHVETMELAYSHALGARTRADVSVFHYRLSDLITLVDVGDNDLTMDNAARASSRGAEFGLTHQAAGGALLRASYAYSKVEDSETEEPVNAPRGIARLSAVVPLGAGLSFAANAQHVGRRATLAGEVDAYTVVNANLRWQPGSQPFALSAGVRNLFDEHYADPAGPEFTQDAIVRRGREFRFEATWSF